jgi:hypothetical protein
VSDTFTFDPVQHTYRLNGVVIPGITFVLKNTGFVDNTWFKPEHSARGHAVHAACQFLIEGNLDWSTVHPEILTRVKGFEKFLHDFNPGLISAETPMYSAMWKFGGTPDLVLEIPNRRSQWIVDIKSGKSGLAAKLQTAAQDILVQETLGRGTYDRFVLELPKEGCYTLIPHTDRTDKILFLNALAAINRRVNEGELKI